MHETTAGRIAALDVLRGVAILGTFGTNVWIFTHPDGPAGFLSSGFAGIVETALGAVSNGKFLALLALLFGVGLELQYRSAVRRSMPWPGRYVMRAAILFVEGLVHYVLVFEFDVLMAYAIASLLVAYLIGRSDRAVRAWMVGISGGYVALLGAGTAALLSLPDDPAAIDVDPTATTSWLAQVRERLDSFLLWRSELVLIVPSATVLFLLGSRLLRAGAFENTAAGARIRVRLMVLGFGVGVPLNTLTAFAGSGWFLVDRYILPSLVSLGLLALVTDVVLRARREPGPARRGLSAVGRTALSCYVFQNVVAGVLCYGWGFGLATRFADARPWWVIGLWLGVCALFTVLADRWLRYFDRGPLEILLHRLQGTRRPPGAALSKVTGADSPMPDRATPGMTGTRSVRSRRGVAGPGADRTAHQS